MSLKDFKETPLPQKLYLLFELIIHITIYFKYIENYSNSSVYKNYWKVYKVHSFVFVIKKI